MRYDQYFKTKDFEANFDRSQCETIGRTVRPEVCNGCLSSEQSEAYDERALSHTCDFFSPISFGT